MRSTKRKPETAYNRAVVEELLRRGHSSKDALQTFHGFYRPLRKTWGLELNPENFVDEMLRVKLMLSRSENQSNNMVNIPGKKAILNDLVKYVVVDSAILGKKETSRSTSKKQASVAGSLLRQRSAGKYINQRTSIGPYKEVSDSNYFGKINESKSFGSEPYLPKV